MRRLAVSRAAWLTLFVLLIILKTAQAQTRTISDNDVAGGQSLAIIGVTVIDATGAEAKAGMTVIVSAGRIAAIGKSGKIRIPRKARVVNGRGKYLIPGLWDMHAHLAKAGEKTLALFLANGVTSVRDMGGDPEMLLKWRKDVAEGRRIGPRIKTPGPILESASNVARMKSEGTVEPVDRFRRPVADPESAEAAVDAIAALGVDFIKIRTVASLDTYKAIAAAAGKRNLALAGHPVTSPEEAINAGQRSIEHGFFPPLTGKTKEQRAELFRRLAANKIAVVPTLVVGEALLTPYEKAAAIVNDAEGRIEERRKYLSGYLIEDWREQLAEKKEMKIDLTRLLEGRLLDMREMHAAGVNLMPGTDAAVLLIYPGFSLHDELRLFVGQIGMTPMEAIVSATRKPAEFFGMSEALGTIEAGKIADLVLLDANPLDNIDNTRKIAAVVAVGRYYPREILARIAIK